MKKNLKKICFVTTMLVFALFSKAQTYKDISDKILLKQYKLAKSDIDKRMSNEKFASKPDAYILKTAVYAALASDSATSLTPEGSQLVSEAEAAFTKYREMDAPSYALVSDVIYKEGPINLYSVLFNKAYKEYQASNWESSFQTFKKVIEVSDILATKQLLNSAVDTTLLILTGYTAEQSNHKDEAMIYYKRLADTKLSGANNEFLYRALVLNSFQKNDMESFDKYRALGKELYPTSEYFDYDRTDFAVGLTQDFATRLKAMEDVLAKDPNNYKANLTVAQLVYDTLHPKDGGKPPANAEELETKMVTSLTKAASIKPDDELVWLVLGDHYIDKADKLNDARSAHVEDMKKRTKPGTAPAKPDLAKRDELDNQYSDAYDKAREPYEKAAEIMAKKQLGASQKQQYRKVAGYLGDIYTYKRAQAKGTDAAKFTTEAKKWNDLYDNLK